MTRIWVLGAGQLGAMLQHAGQPLALDVRPVDIDSAQLPILSANDWVTAEREQWPDTAVTQLLSQHPRFINASVFSTLADRFTQKQLLDQLNLATAPWQAFNADTDLTALHAQFGERVLLKRRRGGYDGRGQYWLQQKSAEDVAHTAAWRDHAIAEARIAFDEEVSLIGARDADGNMIFYPLTLNLHVDGILMASIAPLPRLTNLQSQAENMLSHLLTHLNYVGVMAMECFRVGEHLLINELAPRVHNSGHWTQAGSSLNQFEAHLRAISNLPLTTPAIKSLTVMINLIGIERNNEWLHIPGAELYWYNKAVRAGRKVGHINLCANHITELTDQLNQLHQVLPKQYATVIEWCQREMII